MGRRLTPTALGLVGCPPWCRDDHADVTLVDSCVFHESASLAQVPGDDGAFYVGLTSVTGLDGGRVETVAPVVRLGWDFGENDDADLTLPAARRLAAALLDAADAAELHADAS